MHASAKFKGRAQKKKLKTHRYKNCTSLPIRAGKRKPTLCYRNYETSLEG